MATTAASRLKRVLLVPDSHVPFEDEAAFGLMLRAGRRLCPDIIVILGDFADFYSVSSHSKSPNRVSVLDKEIDAVNRRLTQLDQLGAKEKYYVSGNHEDRLERYLRDHAPAVYNCMSLREALKLDERGWKYTPYKDHCRIGKLYVTHEVGNAGQFAHYKAQAAFESNVIIGHTHRIGYAVVGNAKGEPHVGAMLGWLGDFREVDYMHRVRAKKDWAHGFGVGYLEPSGNIHIQPIPIVDGKCIIEGQIVS